MRRLLRTPQLRAAFEPGKPSSGYYNDLTIKAASTGSPAAGVALATKLTALRDRANPVTIAQLGLGAWQLSLASDAWLGTVAAIVEWLEREIEPDGRVPYQFAMPHTFPLAPPWSSAMAQGEIASLLVRAAASLDRPELLDVARAAVSPLLASSSDLVAVTPAGRVLQEYPTSPPAHVLNGWIFALWGIHDVAVATDDNGAQLAWESGIATVAARLPEYEAGWAWSRYDVYPHRLIHVTSPFYHRLHVEQLRALDALAPQKTFRETATRWERGLDNPLALGIAVVRKGAFRLLEPRVGEV